MKAEIKNRIEQIRQGKVPAGYKKTKQGISPAEWTGMSVKDCLCRVEKPVQVEPETLYTQIGIRSHGNGIFYKEPVTGCALKNKSVFWIEPDCFILNIVFAWEQAVGRTTKAEKGMIGSHRFPMYRPIEDRVDIDYLVYYFLTPRGTNILEEASPGGAGRNRTLGQERFLKSTILLPPIAEQQKIAKILMTQDRVIALREKLLAEKLRQKQYLMQVLLTGKTRLCGSTQIWQYQALKDISCEITKKAGNEKYEVLSISAGIGFVNQAKKFGKLIAGKQYKNYIVISHGDFSYNKGNSKKYPQGCVYPLENQDEAAVPNVFISFRLDKNICFWKFYKYVFENGWLNKQLRRLISSGARGDGLLNLSDEDFYSCIVPVPPLNEQVKIADILSSADQEIDLLKQELEQERRKKKALMQLLLSGIVRVKP